MIFQLINWKTILELIKLPHIVTRYLDMNFVENFEPRPFDAKISPKLIDWMGLEVSKQCLLNDLTEDQNKDAYNISLQASGKKKNFISWIMEFING